MTTVRTERAPGPADDGEGTAMRTRASCQLTEVVETLRGSPIDPPGRHPSQPVHVAELTNTRLVEAFALHGTKDAIACQSWQGDDAGGLCYSGRCVTGGPRKNRRQRLPEVVAPLGLAVRDSIASDRRTRSALGAHRVYACGQDYSCQFEVASGEDGRNSMMAKERAWTAWRGLTSWTECTDEKEENNEM